MDALSDPDPIACWIGEPGIGTNISTKAVGSKEREDITDQYKYKEGTRHS